MMLLHALCLYMNTLKNMQNCVNIANSVHYSVAYIKRSLFEKFCGT